MHTSLRYLAVLAMAVSLSACAVRQGRDFPIDQASAIVPGKSTKADVLSLLGTPYADETATFRKDGAGKELPAPVVLQRLEYFYSERNGEQAPVVANITPHRYLSVYLVGGQVVGINRTSSFQRDATVFDIGKASSLKKKQTTADEVVQLLGQPSGKAVYPLAPTPNGKLYYYQYDMMNPASGYNDLKSLNVGFGDDNLVYDFNVRADSVARPVAPVPVVIPVVVRTK